MVHLSGARSQCLIHFKSPSRNVPCHQTVAGDVKSVPQNGENRQEAHPPPGTGLRCPPFIFRPLGQPQPQRLALHNPNLNPMPPCSGFLAFKFKGHWQFNRRM
jgi:hypothetical protein